MQSYAPVLALVTVLPTLADAQERTHHTFRHSASAKAMAFSPDNAFLAVSVGNQVEFIAPQLGRVVRQYKASPFSMGFSKDSRMIYMISRGNGILFNPQSGAANEVPYRLKPGFLGLALKQENGKLLIRVVPQGSPVEALETIQVNDELIGVADGRNARMEDVIGWEVPKVYGLLNGGFVDTYAQLNVLPKGQIGKQNARTHLVRRKPRQQRGAGYIYVEAPPVKTGENLVLCLQNDRHEFRRASTGEPIAQLQTVDIVNDRGAFAISPDQTRFAGVAQYKNARGRYAAEVFDIATQDRLAIIPLPEAACSDVAFTPDNAHLLVAAWDTVKIVDIAAERVIGSINLGWNPLVNRYEPPRFKGGSTDITITTYDEIRDGSELEQPRVSRSPNQLVSRLAVSSKGLLATADESGNVKLWNLNTGEFLHELPKTAEEKPTDELTFSFDGDWLAYHAARVTHVVDVSDFQTNFAGKIELRSSENAAPKGFQRPTPPKVAPHPTSGRLKLVIMTRPTKFSAGWGEYPQFMAFSPTASELYVGSAAIGEIPKEPQPKNDGRTPIRTRSTVPSDVPLVLGGTIIAGQRKSNSVAAYRVADGKMLRAYHSDPKGAKESKWCDWGTLSHDGSYLAFCPAVLGGLCMFETTTARPLFRVTKEQQFIGEWPNWNGSGYKFAFHQDSSKLFALRKEAIRIYETRSGKYVDEEDLSDRDGVSRSERILTARNAPVFAYGTSLFNSQTAELVAKSATDDEPNYRIVSISADGKVVLTAYYDVYCAYQGELHQLQLLSELKEPDESNFYEEFYAAALTDDGRFCAAANREKIFLVALFDNDGKFSPSLVDTLEGHLQTVDGLAFSRNGKLLASTSLDGSTRLWDVSDLSQKK